ncbi:MAG: transposase [Lentimicrobium sp.]|nr:transposase [Lentimicrobium sp.]
MFKSNSQPGLFSFEMELCKMQRDLLDTSKEKWFYNLILRNVNEDNFKPLYSEKASRPNVAVNILVSALILKELKGISFDELMESVMFDLRFKVALGLVSIDEVPFSRGTLFNFQNRILEHEQQTGINLIEQVFDNLTAKQIKQLSLKTDIQRTDSTLISSNIRKYSRIQLLIEVMIRLERILDETDKQLIGEQLQAYLKTGSDKYVYGLKSNELPRELEKLGKVYHAVHTQISGEDKYTGQKEFINFVRVYKEHFVVVNQEISSKPTEELNSGMLQSPDDQDATYRKKKEQHSKGYTINGTETANPDNPLQLITDIAVNPNNIDDPQILYNRIDKIKEKTPEINEIHTDGGFGSEDNDKKLEALKITQITTAVRGRESEIEKKIGQTGQSPDVYMVECPHQTAVSTPTKQRYKVRFDLNICKECPLKEKCQIFKNKGRYYFNRESYLLGKRNSNIRNIPKERRKIRPNVEALMKEFKTRTRNGKTKVRGRFKTSLFAFNAGIAINFGRIFRYIIEYDLINELFSPDALVFLKNLLKNNLMFFWTRKPDCLQANFGLIRDHTKYFSILQTLAA